MRLAPRSALSPARSPARGGSECDHALGPKAPFGEASKLQTRLVDMQEVYLWDGMFHLRFQLKKLNQTQTARRAKHSLTTAIHRGQACVRLQPLLNQLEA